MCATQTLYLLSRTALSWLTQQVVEGSHESLCQVTQHRHKKLSCFIPLKPPVQETLTGKYSHLARQTSTTQRSRIWPHSKMTGQRDKDQTKNLFVGKMMSVSFYVCCVLAWALNYSAGLHCVATIHAPLVINKLQPVGPEFLH